MPLVSKSTKDLIQAIYNNENRRKLLDKDTALIAFIWRIDGWDDSKPLEENIAKVRSAESIRRTRQKMHEKGLIKYSDEAEERRYEAYKDVKDELGTPIPFFEEDPLDKMPVIKGTGRKETAIIKE